MKKYISLILTLLSFVSSFFVFWFFGDLFDRYFIFALVPLGLAVLIWAISLIVNIVFSLKYYDVVYYISLSVSLLMIVFVIIFPFREAKFNLEFKLYSDEREKVVDMVIDGVIVPDNMGNARLPEKFDHTTSDGSIAVYQNDDEQVICFWVFRGILSSSKQLVYSSGGEELIRETETGHPVIKVEKIKDNWYLVEREY